MPHHILRMGKHEMNIMAGGAGQAGIEAAFATCTDMLRQQDFDRYCACLFSPAAHRGALMALYAFNAEIARIRDVVREPLPGEIRCQWWRDRLMEEGAGDSAEAQSHPILHALLHIIRRYRLPKEPFIALIEARGFDLYDDPMPTMMDLEGYCGETSAALIRLACLILAEGEEPGSAALCGHAGLAYAYTGLLRAFPLHASRQQCYIPHEILIACGVSLEDVFSGQGGDNLNAALAVMRGKARDHLAQLRAGIRTIDPAIAPAFYPVCLVEPYLNQMEQGGYDPFRSRVDLSPLRKFWCIARGAWRARQAA
jgi:15-cis-phytoene synthase